MKKKNVSPKQTMDVSAAEFEQTAVKVSMVSIIGNIVRAIRHINRYDKQRCNKRDQHKKGYCKHNNELNANRFFIIHKKPKKNEISARVVRYATETFCDERTVYRQLEYARRVYKMIRSTM